MPFQGNKDFYFISVHPHFVNDVRNLWASDVQNKKYHKKLIEKTTVYIGIGANLGDRRQNIEEAIWMLDEVGETEVKKFSSLIETEPEGGPPQGKFLNAAAEIATMLSPFELLRKLQEIEMKLGRTREVRWGPRTIDLDILLYGNEIIDTEILRVPHPRMLDRDFVMIPLTEIAPEARHPELNVKISEINEE